VRDVAALSSPLARDGGFRNWARTEASQPRAWHLPAAEDQVVSLVREAAGSGRRVRVVGAGHSFSAIAAPDDLAVSLDRYAGVVGWSEGEVTVRAGTRLRDLNTALAQRGLALPILGSIAQQSVAGAVATGTHGSSLVHGNLASLVTAVRLVDGHGQVVEIGPGESAGDERLDGVRVHLGALGALTELTLRVEPAFALTQTVETVPVGEVGARLEEIGRSAEYVKVWWVPHTPDALVFRYQRTAGRSAERTAGPGSQLPVAERWVDQRVVHPGVLPLLFRWQNRRSGGVPRMNGVVARTLVKGPRTGPSPLMFSTPDPARHDETEAAVPLAQAAAAFDALVALFDGDLRANFIAELRYVRGDRNWLSPAYGGDVVQLGAYTALRPHRDRYFEAFWDAMPAGARPHWGKAFGQSATELAPLYPRWDAFARLRDELDPDRVFGSPFLERILGS
jgi:FAD/FMN-containing dehydrogenase